MKIFFLLLVLPSLFLSFRDRSSRNNYSSHSLGDTSIQHVFDGRTNEWPAQKFETDAASGIKYAIDNDSQNLYLALIILNLRTQMRMMRQGMELYIDTKGKRKEGKGIGFPVKRDRAEDNFNNFRVQQDDRGDRQDNSEERKANMKAMRAAMAINLVSMKVFGFANDEPEEQGLQMAGSANIAFALDSSDAMNVEYKIPMSLLGNISSIQQKEVSVGFKLNGIQMRSNNSNPESGGGEREGGFGARGGRRNFGGGGGGYGSGNRSSQQDFANMIKDQIFWTKYTVR